MTKDYITGILRRDKVYVRKEEASDLISRGYGTLGRKYLILEDVEALYLVFNGKLRVFEDSREISFDQLVERFSKHNSYILPQFLVYRDLRSKGYVVRLGYGETIDFLVYDKGDYPEKPAKFRVIGVDEGIPIRIEKLIDILNFTLINKKELKIAVIERRGEVVYYTLESFTKEDLRHEKD